jgi:hypothetical protein
MYTMLMLGPTLSVVSNFLVANSASWGPTVIGLVIISCIISMPGVIAWIGTAERGLARIFWSGPALLVPAVCLLTLVSFFSCRHEVECSKDLWRILPFYGAVAVAVIWHAALLISLKHRSQLDWLYAIVFLPIFYYYCMLTMALAIRFPL